MKTKLVIISALSAVFALSCSKSTSEGLAGRDEIVFIPTLAETKANLIHAGNMIGQRIHIDGYLAGSETKHLDGNVLYDNYDVDPTYSWTFYTDKIKGVHYYWPQNSKLDVLAYSPAKLQNTYVTIASSKTVTCKDLPMTDSDQKGTLLNEFVCGYKANCDKEDGAIKVTLERPFALVCFYLDEAVRSKLNYIKVKGLNNCGTYDASEHKWSFDPSTSKTDLTCTVNKSYPEEINNYSLLSDSLVVIPQSLRVGSGETEPVKLIFSYTSSGNTNPTITETTIGQASGAIGGQVKGWEPGKVYNYFITLNGAANECRMTLTIGEWKKEGEDVIDVE